MKKGKKNLLSGLSVTLIIVMALMGCSGSGGNTASQEKNYPVSGDTFVLGEKPLEFSFYGHYDWYTMPDWGKDAATKWIKENKKIDVVPISSGGVAKNKLSTMIVAGELPDVIWMDRGADVEKLRSEGMLVPFDDYLNKYPNLKKWAGESTLELLRSPDGKLYQFPNWYTTQPNGNAGYLVNKKIYEELGSPSLETPEDLYVYLKQVKSKYPDVVPLEVGQTAAGVDIMVSAFAENRPHTFNSMIAVPQGDQLVSLFTDPVYRELLQYMSRLYREKLVTQDAFTQKLEQVEQKVINGKVAVYVASSPTEFGSKGNNLLKAQDPDAGYIMVWPVHKAELDRNKIFPGDYKQLGWNVSVITKSAKDPEAIFAFLDWFTGPDGQRTIMWGPEGLYWDGTDEEDMPLFTDKFTSDAKGRDELMNATVNFQWNGNTVYVDNSKMKFESTLPPEKRNFETYWQSEITWKTQMNTTEFANLDPASDSEEGIIAQRVFEIYEQVRAKAISSTTSDQEVLSLLDKAEADAQKSGYDKLLKYKTARWQENKAKMAAAK
ncbi:MULTISPECIES: extracellular solute-binding protein [unclassified Paenibacillus]|uniref:extracellular solute-binding protein n=1 Tax=unclassified Paenibacillus TaxID=185978 RepID=UPI0009A636ED|nr:MULTISPECIES: extracellular solute-binding protein [unclassified Paenibacillus]SLJ88530.1 carbohydrate ABC transporter substrate-binding protein, CUT1 family [Paenibacillus sp. RU5A]SOC63141.1 carbohydrate ABC transporter substrate-binding protein, CUT1 family [Paenibacillus sp. RU26A]SOC68519.1 carbohydrate ABC transporter substrate-binding protein, CUT1 family [Paenibacillus sp. RU5M]